MSESNHDRLSTLIDKLSTLVDSQFTIISSLNMVVDRLETLIDRNETAFKLASQDFTRRIIESEVAEHMKKNKKIFDYRNRKSGQNG